MGRSSTLDFEAMHGLAVEASVKLLFPLVFLIFPSILIVILYPALHNVSETLGGG